MSETDASKINGRESEREAAGDRQTPGGIADILILALKHAQESFFLVAKDGRFLFANEAACRLLGYTQAELLGMSVPNIDSDDQLDRVQARLSDLVKVRHATFESRHRTKDGQIFPVEVNANYLEYDGQGYILALVRDITEQKRAEDALRVSEEKFLKAFKVNPGMMSITTMAEGRYLDVNESWLRAFGFSRDEVIGRTSVELGLVLPEARESLRCTLEQNGYLSELPMQYRTKTGDMHECLSSAEIIDIAGQKHLLVLTNDITERRRTEDALKISEEKLLKVFKANPGMISITTRDEGRYLDVNESWSQALGFSREEVIGRTVVELGILSPRERKVMRRAFEQSGYLRDYPISFRTKAGDMRDCLLSAEIIDIAGQEHLLVLTNDITERRQAEDALKISEEKFLNAFKANPGMMTITTMADGRYIDVSERTLQILGFSREEIIGRTTSEVGVVSSEAREAMRRALEQTGSLRDYPMQFRTKAGETRECLSSAEVIDIAGQKHLLVLSNDITEQKRIEDALRASEEKFLKAFKANPGMITITTMAEGRLVDANDIFLETIGFSLKEVIGRTTAELGILSSLEAREAMRRAFEQDGYLREYPASIKAKTGDMRDCLAAGEMIDIAGKKHFLLLMNDITEQRRAEEALREREEAYRTLTENLPDALFRYDRDCRHVYMNPAAKELMKLPESGVIGVMPADVKFTPEFAPESAVARAYQDMLRDVMETGQPGEYEFDVDIPATLPGEKRRSKNMRTRVVPERNRQGEIVGALGTARDITVLREAERQLRTLVENHPDFIVRFDSEGRYSYVNPAVTRAFGATVEYFIGRTLLDPELAVLGLELSPLHESIVQTAKKGMPVNREECWLTTEGQRYFEVRLIPEKDEMARVVSVLGIARDITERIHAEIEKVQLESQLLQSQKMEAIGTMAGGIAHDFNNILGIIMGNVDLTLKSAGLNRELGIYLSRIMTASERARDLIKQVLTFSRQNEHRMIPLKVAPLIRESIKLLTAAVSSTIQIEQKIDIAKDVVIADPIQIHQVFLNLCTNSAYAMRDKGGFLKVSLSNIEISASSPEMVLPVPRPGSYLDLAVSDTGQGIALDIIDKIFDPFFTTRREDGGSGLGLSVVHGIVKQHEGGIAVQSSRGAKTVFHVYLPLCEGDGDNIAMETETPLIFGSGQILFVDDEEAMVVIAEEMLRYLGYKVVGTTDSQAALALFKGAPDLFDLVITDLTMPHLSGDSLAQEMALIRPDIPIIFCTATATREAREKVQSNDSRDFLTKPFDIKTLASAVSNMLANSKQK